MWYFVWCLCSMDNQSLRDNWHCWWQHASMWATVSRYYASRATSIGNCYRNLNCMQLDLSVCCCWQWCDFDQFFWEKILSLEISLRHTLVFAEKYLVVKSPATGKVGDWTYVCQITEVSKPTCTHKFNMQYGCRTRSVHQDHHLLYRELFHLKLKKQVLKSMGCLLLTLST